MEEEKEENDTAMSNVEEEKAAVKPQAQTKGYGCSYHRRRRRITKCRKFYRTTQALGSHLRNSHGLQRATTTASGKNDAMYIECYQ